MTSQEKLDLLKSITEDDYCNIADSDWPKFQDLLCLDVIPDKIATRVSNMLQETEQKYNKSSKFCALAFYGREYRLEPIGGRHDVLRCCSKSPDDIQPVLDHMIQGVESRSCNVCWRMEQIGAQSLRQIKNATLDHLLNLDIVNLYNQAANEKIHPAYMYKIETNNICNSLCVTCSSKYSSAWQKLERDNGEDPHQTVRFLANEQGIYFDKKLSSNPEVFAIDYATAKFINFFGGEPTSDPTVYKVLEQLVEHGNTNCFVSFTTHGNFNFTPAQQAIILKFPRMHINFSIDAVYKKFEYVRYPLSWEKLNQNIKWCRDRNIDISVNWTLSSVNVFYFDEIKTWLEDNQINFRMNLSNNFKSTKEHSYAITSLSQRVKEIIINRTRSSEVKQLLSVHQSSHDNDYQALLKDLIKQDRWKNISIYDYMPKFAEVIHQDLVKYRC